MSGWDVGHISSANLGIRAVDDIDYAGQRFFPKDDAVNRFRTFLRNFQSSSGINFPYREQIRENITDKLYYITVDLDDISTYDNGILLPLLVDRPNDYLPLFEEAAKKVAFEQLGGDDGNQSIIDGLNDNIRIQILLKNYNKFTELRSLSANNVSKLISIRGFIISASRSRIKATALTIMCKNCKMQKIIQCPNGFGGARLPRECDNRPQAAVNGAMGQQSIKCPLDPFIIIADQSHYIDQQRLKLQEAPESIPTGEMPRTLSLALERQLVGTIKPGARVIAIGMYTTYEAASAAEKNKTGANDVGIRIPYIRVFGIENESEAGDIMIGKFTPEEEQQMEQLSQTPNLYEKIWTSIAPAIFDSEDTKNIKKSIALQLFGGTRKHLPDGMRLRGDINILLLGDPSVAKSQFLKFAHQVAPIGVYTSGKGASAAGLTASVIRDPSSGEFHLEGGALVLGDGGLVCIDEFDKMREQDRVAIHEAMEQQTISIAKAGITTILNSRTSVLAAANPIFGRYDDMRSPTENIDFQTSILSRFDLIFIVRDIQDEARDTKLAKYVIKVHKERDNAVKEDKKDIGMIDIPLLKKYIAFARQRCSPRLSEEAAALLKSQYVQFRDTFGKQREQNADGAPSAIPITVRQLEAIIRLSESMARLELSPIATSVHVQEAIRLFQVSTYRAATSSFHESGIASAEFDRNVKLAETEILNRVALHAKINVAQIKAHLMARNHDPIGMGKAMDNLVKKGQLIYMNQGKMIERRA